MVYGIALAYMLYPPFLENVKGDITAHYERIAEFDQEHLGAVQHLASIKMNARQKDITVEKMSLNQYKIFIDNDVYIVRTNREATAFTSVFKKTST